MTKFDTSRHYFTLFWFFNCILLFRRTNGFIFCSSLAFFLQLKHFSYYGKCLFVYLWCTNRTGCTSTKIGAQRECTIRRGCTYSTGVKYQRFYGNLEIKTWWRSYNYRKMKLGCLFMTSYLHFLIIKSSFFTKKSDYKVFDILWLRQ